MLDDSTQAAGDDDFVDGKRASVDGQEATPTQTTSTLPENTVTTTTNEVCRGIGFLYLVKYQCWYSHHHSIWNFQKMSFMETPLTTHIYIEIQ